MKIKDLVDILDQYNEKSEVTVSTSECLDDDFPLTKVAVIHRGAESFDKKYRTEGKNWWRDERVSIKAVNKAIKNSNNIDYVISHCAPLSIRNKIFLNENIPFNPNEVDESCKNLELLYAHIAGKKWEWFMGHYHLDVVYKPFYVLYNRIMKLED